MIAVLAGRGIELHFVTTGEKDRVISHNALPDKHTMIRSIESRWTEHARAVSATRHPLRTQFSSSCQHVLCRASSALAAAGPHVPDA